MNAKGLLSPVDSWAFSIAVSHDARYVAFGSDRLQLWDSATTHVRTLDAMRSSVNWCGDGSFFPGDDFSFIDMGIQYCLSDIKFIDDSTRFAVSTGDGTYAVWDAESVRLC